MPDESTRCPQCGKSFASTVRICPEDGTVLEHQTATTSQLGKVLDGKYRLDAFLSQGGMGSVYRATHVMLGKTVAVKLINPELLTTPEIVRRFQREARAATALHHPNIVAVYDLGQTADGTLYIAMEFVDGPSLKTVITNGGPVAPARTIALLRQIASALSFAHRHNIIHRDLKPHNIMIATPDNGQELPKLVDFGIAKTFDEATQLTMTGFALGTPQYMAPEQAEGRPVDARSDLYSLGIIFYEMLTADVPFNDPSAPAILIKHIKEIPVAPSVKNPRAVIPPELETIVLRCLEKDPARRFQNADEFIAVLEESAVSIPGAAAAMQPTVLSPGITPSAFMTPSAGAPGSGSGSRQVPSSTGAPPVAPTTGGPSVASVAPARIEPPVAQAPAAGTRPTAIAPPGAIAASPPSRASNTLGLVAVLVFLLIAAAGAFVYLKQQREQSPVASTDAPVASPAMAGQSPPPTPPESSTSVPPPSSTSSTAASPSTGASPNAAASTTPSSSTAPASQPPAAGTAARGTGASPGITAAAKTGPNTSSGGGTGPDSVASRRTAQSGAVPGAAASRAAAGATRGQDTAAQPAPAAAAMPEHPAVFFQCAGAPEICSVLRTAVDDALDKGGFSNVRSPARADIAINAAAGGIQERVSQEFKTTFAVRTYAIELNGETTHTNENVPMPAPTNVSFDPQFGSERVVEKARLVASGLVEKLNAFVQKKRGG